MIFLRNSDRLLSSTTWKKREKKRRGWRRGDPALNLQPHVALLHLARTRPQQVTLLEAASTPPVLEAVSTPPVLEAVSTPPVLEATGNINDFIIYIENQNNKRRA